jgi:hypothetical protein
MSDNAPPPPSVSGVPPRRAPMKPKELAAIVLFVLGGVTAGMAVKQFYAMRDAEKKAKESSTNLNSQLDNFSKSLSDQKAAIDKLYRDAGLKPIE